MVGYRPTQVRKPANETDFEKNCVVLFKEILKDPNVKRLGTRGQVQNGVDLVGRRDRDPAQIVGVQCKLKSGRSKLTEKEVRDEVKAALGYQPPLSEYFIVTTSKDDTKLTQLAQQLMQTQQASGRRLHIEVWGWDTLQDKIDQHESAKNAFDPGFSPSIASQDRKLDALLAGQKQAATHDQLVALTNTIRKTKPEALTRLPPHLADRELRESLSRVLRRRGFANADATAELTALADRAIDGDLSLASSTIRSEVCDRAARANARAKTVAVARRFREHAAVLVPSRDLFIADALLKEAGGDPDTTLRLLRTRADPETRAALFTTLIRQCGIDAALKWVRTEGFAPSAFSAVGALNLILSEIESEHFDEALADIAKVPAEYFSDCPALRLLRAQLNVASILAVDQKAAIFQGLPIDPRTLQLAAGQKTQQHIRAAHQDLRALLKALEELDLRHLEAFVSEFELWLRLEDIAAREEARDQLTAEIADPSKTLRRVRLALAYDVSFNQDALQRHLAGQKDIGGWTAEERFAAFLIAYHSDDPNRISEFFDKHHDDLFAQTHLVRSALAGIEIEVLARTGHFEEARRHIALHRGSDLTPEQADELSERVAHIEWGDEIESLRQRYEESQSLTDLRLLVAGLRSKRDIGQLATYAPALARATKTLGDFGLAIKSLFDAKLYSGVVTLAEELPDVYALDQEYVAIKGWSLHGLGRVVEARTIARGLLERRAIASDRELATITAIETGDWGYLQAILVRDVARVDVLSAKDLIRLAQLALESGSPYVNHFRDAALQKAPDDPYVNLGAYILATERGEEYRSSQAHEWLRKAIEKSGSDGPVHPMSMRELVDRAPSWNEHANNVDQLLRRAEIPVFMAGRNIRRQLIDLTLGQALRNSDGDSRRIGYPVFAFSGARPACDLSGAKSVAFDITALITLDYLGLLEKVLAHFERPIISPKTLSMLFMERQFLKVQQPSQIAKAERIQSMIARGRLKVMPPVPNIAPVAAKEVGHDLAALLSAAQRDGGLVVRTAPVSKLGSFLEETADMSACAPVLTDTLTALSFLAGSGKVDAAIRRNAQAYLQQVDAGWPAAKAIDETATLYLDDLAVTYLDHVGVLDYLAQSVAATFVHEVTDKQTREVLRHGKHVEALLSAIERIRAIVGAGIEMNRVGFSMRHREREGAESDRDAILDSAPSLDLLSDLSGIDATIADDRYLNKLPTWIDNSGRKAASGSVIDVLAVLRAAGQIDEEAYWRARHQLRAASYYAVPLELTELLHHISAAPIMNGEFRETPELRGVRESLALPQVNACFIATEAAWLSGMCLAIWKGMREVWLRASNLDDAEAQADWLLSILPDPMEWCLTPENEGTWAAARQQVAAQAALAMVFVDAPAERRKHYVAWLEKRVVTPLQRDHPEIWDAALDHLKSFIPHLMEIDDGEDTQ